MENRYRGQWIVPLSHCDETGRLSVQGALGEFMDIAALHAEQIGVGFAAMARRREFWLTVHCRIELCKPLALLRRKAEGRLFTGHKSHTGFRRIREVERACHLMPFIELLIRAEEHGDDGL